jgi:protein TonB
LAYPTIKTLITKYIPEPKNEIKEIEYSDLAPPPPLENEPPPPPPPPPAPPPTKPTIKFVEMEVKKDEEVKKEEKPPTVEELKEVDPGTKTVEGDKNAVIVDENVDLKKDDGPKIVEEKPQPKEDEVFQFVEQNAEFPGGTAAMMKFIQTNINYPSMARENGIEGKVFVKFIVNSDGSIQDVKVLKGQGGGLDEEAVRVVKMMPKWKAAKQNGKEVRCYFNLPIVFKLE